MGLQLSEQLAAVLCPVLRLDLQCVRCHGRADLTLQQGTASSVTCSRCRGQLTAAYHPSLVHAASTTLGFLDLHGCVCMCVCVCVCVCVTVCVQLHCRRCHNAELQGDAHLPAVWWGHQRHWPLLWGLQGDLVQELPLQACVCCSAVQVLSSLCQCLCR